MHDIIQHIKSSFLMYKGEGCIFYLFLISLLLLIIMRKGRRREKDFFLLYSIGILIIYACPLTAKIIMDYCIGRDVYWRMFWLLPIVLVIAYVLTLIFSQIKQSFLKGIWIVVAVALIGICGNSMYHNELFKNTTNYYKLPQEVIEICDIVLDDAEGGYIKMVVPNSLTSYIRQYNGSIKLAYGRETEKDGQVDTPEAGILYDVMNNSFEDPAALAESSKMVKCNYIVLRRTSTISESISDYSFEYLNETENYIIFRETEI